MIHPTAIIEPGAKLGANVSVGPWSYIGNDVEIGDNTVIESHVVIKGPTRIGQHNHIYQFATVGEASPDLKYKGEPTTCVIGDHNVIRECVTIHRGTVQDRGETTIGNHNLLMAYCHVAHDCVLGNHIIMANNASLAGHVKVDDWVIMAGFSGVHQFCHVGAHAFLGMYAAVGKDVPPYTMLGGTPTAPFGINSEGLRRRGFTSDAISAIKRGYKTLYRSELTVEQAKEALAEQAHAHPELALYVEFLNKITRGILR